MNVSSFSLAGVLAAGLAFTAGQARGAVIYSGPVNVSIPTNMDGVFIDIDGMTSGSQMTGWDINPFFGGSVIATSASFHPVADSTSNTAAILGLGEGVEVDDSLTYASSPGGSSMHMGPGPDQFVEAEESYFGFSFTTNGGDGPYFGWVRLQVTANNPGGVVTGWAYDDSGAPITVGAVPEPTGLMLLALAPLLAWRRRRLT